MKKVNILYCIEYLSHAGTEKQLMELIYRINRSKFQPYLCCLRKTNIENDKRLEANKLFRNIDCPKIQLDFHSFKDYKILKQIYKLTKYIHQNNIDIIQTYFQDPTVLGVIAGKFGGGNKKVIANFRDLGFWRDKEKHFKMKAAYRLCSSYIANSNAVKTKFIEFYNIKPYKINVIYNGIDIQKFKAKGLKPINNILLKKKIRVGIVANLNRKVKRVDLFIMAAAIVKKEIKNIEFVIAGDGNLKNELIKLADDLGVKHSIHFLGIIKDIKKLLSTIDIGVLCSDSEGFSNAILEYMISGVPVIATDVGGNKEAICNEETGYLIPAGDYYELSEKIISLANNNDIYNKFVHNAYKDVVNKYSIEKNIKLYERFYEKLVS